MKFASLRCSARKLAIYTSSFGLPNLSDAANDLLKGSMPFPSCSKVTLPSLNSSNKPLFHFGLIQKISFDAPCGIAACYIVSIFSNSDIFSLHPCVLGIHKHPSPLSFLFSLPQMVSPSLPPLRTFGDILVRISVTASYPLLARLAI